MLVSDNASSKLNQNLISHQRVYTNISKGHRGKSATWLESDVKDTSRLKDCSIVVLPVND